MLPRYLHVSNSPYPHNRKVSMALVSKAILTFDYMIIKGSPDIFSISLRQSTNVCSLSVTLAPPLYLTVSTPCLQCFYLLINESFYSSNSNSIICVGLSVAFTLSKALVMTPFSLIRYVVRTMPIYVLP